MNDEKRIRDLMARLVSMSPEPPPLPEEETPTARHRVQKNWKPAFVFSAAVALVALLALPLLLFSVGREPVVAGTSTTTTLREQSTSQSPDVSTTTTIATTTTTNPATTTTAQAIGGTAWTGVVYLFQDPDNSFTGNPALVPLLLEVTAEPGTFSEHSQFTMALSELAMAGTELPDGFGNAIPPEVQVVDHVVDDGTVRADMNEAFLAGAGGLLADTTMLNQLVYALTWTDPDAVVEFTVDGRPVEAFGSAGISLTDPVDRETFIDDLSVIFLTRPVSEFEHVYAVNGRANTFEAILTVQVLDSSGQVTHEEFTMASCGSGCWGEFGVGVEADLIIPGESAVRLLTYSAEDGSATNVITIPIPADGVWRLSTKE